MLVSRQEDSYPVTDDEYIVVEDAAPATALSTTTTHPHSPPRSVSSEHTLSNPSRPNSTVNDSSNSRPTSPGESGSADATTNGASAASGTDDDIPGAGDGGNARIGKPIDGYPKQENGIDVVISMDSEVDQKPQPPPQVNGVSVSDDEIEVSSVIHVASSSEPSRSKPASKASESPLPSLPPLSSQPESSGSVNGNPSSKPSSKGKGLELPPTQSQKPKSQKRRSPSPVAPLPSRAQVKTIRLSIPLGGPERYAVDVSELARETGQLPELPQPLKRDTSDSEGEDEPEPEPEPEASSVPGPSRRGRRARGQDTYDVNDPFIDDSELAIDERKFFAQTRQQGFYVSQGEVAVLKDKSSRKGSDDKGGILQLESPQKKPKSKKLVPKIIPLAGSLSGNLSSPGPSTLPPMPPPSQSPLSAGFEDRFGTSILIPPIPNAQASGSGSRETPIAIDDGEVQTNVNGVEAIVTAGPSSAGASASASVSANGAGTDLKRKASEQSVSGRKKRKTIEIESFHPLLQAQLHVLKDAISKESFEQKGKFPPSLKPLLVDTAIVAIRCGEYDDRFFSLMPKLFIYNKFTMQKLIKRTVFPEHSRMLAERTEVLLRDLKGLVDEGFGKAQADHETALAHWKAKKDGATSDGAQLSITPNDSASGTPYMNGGMLPTPSLISKIDSNMEVDTPPPSTQNLADAAGDGAVTDSAGVEKPSDGAGVPAPTKRYRLTSQMRDIIWELVVLSNEAVKIENEKNELEKSPITVSEQGARKVLYQKIVSSFPEGWMNSGQISREVSIMKKKFEVQQQEAAEAGAA